jgi:hypothetical protein
LKDLRTVPSSIERISRGTQPPLLVKINNMIPGLQRKKQKANQRNSKLVGNKVNSS